MARWIKTLNIKDLLSEDNSPEEARRLAGEISTRLRTLPPGMLNDREMQGILEAFGEISETGAVQTESVDEFNNVLTMLYDWADVNRVWLGI